MAVEIKNNPDRKTILLVEDETLIALREEMDLEQRGYTVRHVTTGKKAIETVLHEKAEIDLILMDIDLGTGMDGTQAAEEILQHKDIPVVFLSSHTEPDIVEKTEKITSYGYVVKDSGITVFDASIKMAFKLHKATMQMLAKEKELRESNERFRLAIDGTGEGIWDWNRKSGQVNHDRWWKRFLGYEKETEEYNFSSWKENLHPDSIPVFEKALQDYLNGHRKYFEYEYQIKTKSGEWKWIWTRGVCLEYDQQNQPVRFIGTHRDITESKRVDEQLTELSRFQDAALNNDLVWINALDKDGNITFWNKAAERISGYASGEIIGHGKIWEWLYPDEKYRANVYARTKGIIDLGNRDENSETTIICKNGQERVILWNSKNIKNEKGKVVGSIALGVDVTKRKKAEETIKRQLREKEVLLREIHHRIKNNISSIEGLLKLQAGAIENIEAKEIINAAVNRVGSMRRIYDKLLIADEYKELSVSAYLKELVSSVVDIFPKKQDVDINLEIEDFSLDVKRLFLVGTILNELLTNSFKYAFTETDTGCITIYMGKKKNKIHLSIKDNGSGLPEDFDIENTGGFGLRLVKMLIQQLDGTFTIERNNGTESIVTFEE